MDDTVPTMMFKYSTFLGKLNFNEVNYKYEFEIRDVNEESNNFSFRSLLSIENNVDFVEEYYGEGTFKHLPNYEVDLEWSDNDTSYHGIINSYWGTFKIAFMQKVSQEKGKFIIYNIAFNAEEMAKDCNFNHDF